MLFGIDVSRWDFKPVDWSLCNHEYHLVKVSEGTVIDKVFKEHWQGAKGKTRRGAYHFFRPFVDPILSAQRTVDYLGGDLGELPLSLDIETTDGRTDTLARAKMWKDEYERLTKTKIMVYSRISFMKYIGVTSTTSWLRGVPFWEARYPYDEVRPVEERDKIIHEIATGKRNIIMPRRDAFPPMDTVIWQWTARGKPQDVKGYYLGWDGKKEVDFNFARPEWIAQFPHPGGNPPATPQTGITIKIGA
jgi:GH25 family lysozyme M1 (1,4-beta-N-acetylmuramidase)